MLNPLDERRSVASAANFANRAARLGDGVGICFIGERALSFRLCSE